MCTLYRVILQQPPPGWVLLDINRKRADARHEEVDVGKQHAVPCRLGNGSLVGVLLVFIKVCLGHVEGH